MKKVLLFAFALVLLDGCSWFQKAAPILAPIDSVICDGETTLATKYAQWLADSCGGTYADAGAQDVLTGLKTLNLCATPVAQSPAPAGMAREKMPTFGDYHPMSGGKMAVQGILSGVATIICPLGDSLLVGLASGALMSSQLATDLKCTHQVSDPNINGAVTSVCEAALAAFGLVVPGA